jgi:hypothetical protein
VTVALVVLWSGLHNSVPTPPPDPMHWLTVTPEVSVEAGTLLITVTSQST